MGDVDIESEVIRGLGSLRFAIYSILRIANLRKYNVKLWYKKAVEEIYSEAKSVSGADHESNKTENSDDNAESETEINFTKQEIVEESEADDNVKKVDQSDPNDQVDKNSEKIADTEETDVEQETKVDDENDEILSDDKSESGKSSR